jgi:hypothetical protein
MTCNIYIFSPENLYIVYKHWNSTIPGRIIKVEKVTAFTDQIKYCNGYIVLVVLVPSKNCKSYIVSHFWQVGAVSVSLLQADFWRFSLLTM